MHGLEEAYCIGAWAELSEHDWCLAKRVWNESENDGVPEFPGVLANDVPRTYEHSTRGLQVLVQLHGEMRPTLRLVGTGHALENEQRQGISPHRALHFSGLVER